MYKLGQTVMPLVNIEVNGVHYSSAARVCNILHKNKKKYKLKSTEPIYSIPNSVDEPLLTLENFWLEEHQLCVAGEEFINAPTDPPVPLLDEISEGLKDLQLLNTKIIQTIKELEKKVNPSIKYRFEIVNTLKTIIENNKIIQNKILVNKTGDDLYSTASVVKTLIRYTVFDTTVMKEYVDNLAQLGEYLHLAEQSRLSKSMACVLMNERGRFSESEDSAAYIDLVLTTDLQNALPYIEEPEGDQPTLDNGTPVGLPEPEERISFSTIIMPERETAQIFEQKKRR